MHGLRNLECLHPRIIAGLADAPSRRQTGLAMPFNGFDIRLGQARIFLEDSRSRISSFDEPKDGGNPNTGAGNDRRLMRHISMLLDPTNLRWISLPQLLGFSCNKFYNATHRQKCVLLVD